MQRLINLDIERFQEEEQNYFVATSHDVQGLVAEAETIEAVITIATDLIPLLLEIDKSENDVPISITPATTFQLPLVVLS